VEHPAASNGRRLCWKHVDRRLHVCVASTVSFQVQDAVVGVVLMHVSVETVRHLDHAQRPVRRLGDACGGDVHDVFQTPVLCGVTTVALDREAQAVVVPQRVVGELWGTAEPDHMGLGVRVPVRLDADDTVQRWGERLVPQWGLVDAGLEVILNGRGGKRLLRNGAVIQLAALLARWASPSLRAVIGQVPGRVGAQLSDAGHLARWGCAPGVVLANVTIPHQGGQRDTRGEQVPPGVAQALEPSQRRRQRHDGLVLVLTALWTPRATRYRRRWWRLRARFRLAGRVLCGAAHDRLDAPGERAPCLDTHPRAGKDGPSWPWRAGQPGTEPLQAVGGLAGWRDDHFIARQEVEMIGTVHLRTAAAPPPHRPWSGRGAKARHRARAAPCARPPGQAPPGHAPGHDEPSERDPTAAAEGRRRDMGSATWEPCEHVHSGLLRRLSVAVVVDGNATLVLRQKPFHVHVFWRRY
jgi:hypothetical protein